jgi:hypothetical protein
VITVVANYLGGNTAAKCFSALTCCTCFAFVLEPFHRLLLDATSTDLKSETTTVCAYSRTLIIFTPPILTHHYVRKWPVIIINFFVV